MAKVNLTLPNLDLDNLNDSQIIRKIASYLYIQNEQLRYELTHIDEDNMASESSTTIQGMTQAQIQKAIEEAGRKNQDIDLSNNSIIINIQRRLDNLTKLQSQDATNITRITKELGNKVSQTTYKSGLSGLKTLISGNTGLINGLNEAYQLHLSEYGNHKHSIYINDSTGVISMGGPTASPSNPNISATTYFKKAVAEAKVKGERDGRQSVYVNNVYISPGETKTIQLVYDKGGHETPTGATFQVIASDGGGVTGLTYASRIGYNSVMFYNDSESLITTGKHYWWYKDSLD